MSRHKVALFGAAAIFSIFTVQSAAAQTAEAPAAGAPSTSSVSEIVVTANKRQESVNKVGMSIAAATGAQLTRLGITDTSQLQKIVPGFSYAPSAYGTPVYSIRGIGFQDTSLAASPTVSVYVDEAPLPFSSMTQGASLDLQRVEVLKGPQGTLFGENATGGAINYIANKPTDHFQAGADLSYSRFNTVDLQGFVSGPITDTLDFRVALRTIQADGWQKSYGPQKDGTLGAQSFYNGRAALLWKPNDRFKALLTISGYQDGGETTAPQLAGFESLNGNTSLPAGLLAFPLAPHDDRAADWSTCVNTGAFRGVGDAGHPMSCTNYHKNNTFYMGSLRMDYDLGNDMTLTSLTTHEQYDRYTPLEGDGTTYNDYQSLQGGFLNTTYQELRLAGKFAGKGNWIVGGNYEYDSTWDNFLQTYSDSSSSTVFGEFLGPARPIDRQKTSTYAIFGNVEYPVTDTITLQAGVRYTNQHKDFFGCGLDSGDGSWAHISQQIQNLLIKTNRGDDPATIDVTTGPGIDVGPGGCGTTGPAPDFLPGITYEHLNEDNVSWRAGVNWKVTPQILAYFNASQGWKSGGFPTIATASYAQLAPAKQEGLLAYEGGFKAQLFDRQLQLNAAGFYYDYHDKQILGDLSDPIFGALPALVNVPNSHVIGFEVSGVWTPHFLEGLTISPSVSYAGSKIDKCSPSLPSCAALAAGGNVPVAIPAGHFHNFNYRAQQQDFNGEAFPNAPQWQASIDAQYEWNLRDDMKAFVGATATYTGQTNSGFGDFGVLNIPAYTLVDLRAGIEKDAWRVQFWGRNVTNQYYWTTDYHVNDVFVRYAGMPATYGVTISYRYH